MCLGYCKSPETDYCDSLNNKDTEKPLLSSFAQIESLQRQKGKLVSDLEDASQWHKEDLETQQQQYFQVSQCPIPMTWEFDSLFSIS